MTIDVSVIEKELEISLRKKQLAEAMVVRELLKICSIEVAEKLHNLLTAIEESTKVKMQIAIIEALAAAIKAAERPLICHYSIGKPDVFDQPNTPFDHGQLKGRDTVVSRLEVLLIEIARDD